MSVQQAYDRWSSQYDTNENRTRDLEATALREIVSSLSIRDCLEIGCGTGKNTAWLFGRCEHVTAVDFSEEMLARARRKIVSEKVTFVQADITKEWQFAPRRCDLITFSLVLEHIENLDFIFSQAANSVGSGGYVYIGELHPYKQYGGTKARFDTGEGTQVLECYKHDISEFTRAAVRHGFEIYDLNEFFDDDNSTGIPRILTLLLKKT